MWAPTSGSVAPRQSRKSVQCSFVWISILLSLDFNFEPEKVFSCLCSQTPLELFFNFGENISDILFVKMSIISKKNEICFVFTHFIYLIQFYLQITMYKMNKMHKITMYKTKRRNEAFMRKDHK